MDQHCDGHFCRETAGAWFALLPSKHAVWVFRFALLCFVLHSSANHCSPFTLAMLYCLCWDGRRAITALIPWPCLWLRTVRPAIICPSIRCVILMVLHCVFINEHDGMSGILWATENLVQILVLLLACAYQWGLNASELASMEGILYVIGVAAGQCVFHIFFYSYITSVGINFHSMLVILCIMPLRCSSVCFVWTAVPSVSLYCDHLHLCGALNSRCCYYTRCMSHAHCCIMLWQIKRMHIYWTSSSSYVYWKRHTILLDIGCD